MNTLLRLKSILLLAGLGLIGAPAQAASGVGPYYAMPAWDQTLPAATRFLVLTNMSSEAVLDRETGLVWEQSRDTTARSWYGAVESCLNLVKGGKKGWRMPTVEELASLVDPNQSDPALPSGHPFGNVQLKVYWSATGTSSEESYAWQVYFSDGSVIVADKTVVYNPVWCVRGGKGSDAQ